MNFVSLFIVIVVAVLFASIHCDHRPVLRDVDFVSNLLRSSNEESLLRDQDTFRPITPTTTTTNIYFAIQCDSNGDGDQASTTNLENALDAAKLLATKWTSYNKFVDFVIIPISKHGSQPTTMYTSNVNQLEEALRDYACKAYLTSPDIDTQLRAQSEGIFSILSTIVDRMHQRDTTLLFSSADENYNLWPSSLKRKLTDERVSMKILLRDQQTESISIENLQTNVDGDSKGRLFLYTNKPTVHHQQHQMFSIENSTHQNSNPLPIYEIKTVKKQVTQNTRTVFSLPAQTWQIFTTVQGAVRKALLKSPSGITINLATQWVMPYSQVQHMIPIDHSREINLQLPIYSSPADWILLADGDSYNITAIMVVGNPDHSRHIEHTAGMPVRPQFPLQQMTGDELNYSGMLRSGVQQRDISTDGEDSSPQTFAKRQDLEEIQTMPQIQSRSGVTLQRGFAARADPITEGTRPTIIDVDLLSTFFVYPGEDARIVFNVHNNKIIPSSYYFRCFYVVQPCLVHPIRAFLAPGETVRVFANVKASGSEGSSNIVALVSESLDFTEKKVYLYVGRSRSDTRKPDIDYEYNGNCDDANTGNTCHLKKWSANIVAQDTESGLLNFWSEPLGLVYTSEFISGTKDVVTARYAASCCNTKVDILASDLRGNTYRRTLDVEHQYLSVVEIIAIVLGAILLIILVIGLIYGIIRWKRKANERTFLNN